MSGCEHPDFVAHVDVSRIVPELPAEEEGRKSRPGDDVVAFRAAVRVACAVCGASLGFRVPDVGDLPDRPAVSPDALELRVPLIGPAELELLGPLAAMRGDGLPGGRRELLPPSQACAGEAVTARELYDAAVAYLTANGWARDPDDPGVWLDVQAGNRTGSYPNYDFGAAVESQLARDGIDFQWTP